MKAKSLLLLSLFPIAFASCDCEPGDTIRPAEKIELNAAESRAANAVNEFGVDFFAQVCAAADAEGSNIMLSPLSVATFVSVAANACDDNTGSQIAATLGCEDIEALNSYSGKLVSKLSALDPRSTFTCSNSLRHHTGTHPKASFVSAAKSYYDIELFERDLHGQGDTGEQIRRWVSDKTQGKIDNFNALLGVSDALLVNALYFKGEWVDKFEASKTHSDIFNGATSVSDVDMMHQSRSMGYAASETCSAVKKDFGNGAFQALFILPAEGSSLSSRELSQIVNANYSNTKVQLSFPKFSYREQMLNVTRLLSDMGIDYSKVNYLEEATGASSDIFQDSFIKFDEDGAELAAVTYNGYTSSGVEQVIEMNFNRPFYFFIREKSTGALLLAGKINTL